MFGGGDSCTSAYMLQYRKYDPSLKKEEQNADEAGPLQGIEVGDDLIPDYQRQDIDTERDELLEQQLQLEERLLTLKLRVYEQSDRDHF